MCFLSKPLSYDISLYKQIKLSYLYNDIFFGATGLLIIFLLKTKIKLIWWTVA